MVKMVEIVKIARYLLFEFNAFNEGTECFQRSFTSIMYNLWISKIKECKQKELDSVR